MSDFDEVLERLVTDPAFQQALQADPQAALRGYHLTRDEWQVLQAQVEVGAGDSGVMEARLSKSGLFGLVGPIVSALGHVESGAVPQAAAVPPQPGVVPDSFGVGHVEATSGVGHVEAVDASHGQPAVDYHTRVDADGDGRWDKFQAVERGDGGVDILVDRNHDGVVDFVGHDYNRDGLVDDADYDTNFDGSFDTRMSDVDGDGWLDTREPYSPPTQSGFGMAPQAQSGVGFVPPDEG